MSYKMIIIKQLTKKEVNRLQQLFADNPNLHELIGIGRTACWKARTGKNIGVDNINACRKFLNNQNSAA